MSAVTTIGHDPARIDIEVCPGEPVDSTMPVLDANSDQQDITGWTLTATVYSGDTVLHEFAPSVVAGGIQIYASPEQTAAWADWPAPSVRWSLWLTPPASPPYLFAAGWIRVTTH